MASSAAHRLQPIDLLRIYGNLEYEWDLRTDRIDWQGPFNRLISPDIPLYTGSSFGNLLSVESFRIRAQELHNAYLSKDPYYSVLYYLNLPNHERALVLEEGQVFKNNRTPNRIRGYLRFVDSLNFEDTTIGIEAKYSGYDVETGLPGREVMYENLASVIEHAIHTEMPGAYIALSIDNLTQIATQYSPKVIQHILKQLVERVRGVVRSSDIIGRMSSTCLSLILPDCDDHGIIKMVERVTHEILMKPFSLNETLDTVFHISASGVLFPSDVMDATAIMKNAEKSVFEAQGIKGISSFAAPSANSIYVLQRSNQSTTGDKRRITDV